MSTTPYEVTYRKADARYYVDLDGVEVGWVCKDSDGRGWSFWANVRDSIVGERMASASQRQVAVEYGLGRFRIFHFGRVFRLDFDRESDTYMKDLPVDFDTDRLKATESAMCERRYGLVG